ncbi:hypothetical protein LguiB_012999 [Lonicera macranthoides]
MVVNGLPSGLTCLYRQEPVKNKSVATKAHIAGIPNRNAHGLMYGSAIPPITGTRTTPTRPSACHRIFVSFSILYYSYFVHKMIAGRLHDQIFPPLSKPKRCRRALFVCDLCIWACTHCRCLWIYKGLVGLT